VALWNVVLIIHILAGTVCLGTGAVALLARKRKGAHPKSGELYHGGYVVIFVTSVILAVLNWAQSAYLFYIALFSYGLAFLGYLARKRRWRQWLAVHISGMCGSYIGVITAVLVVNSDRLPGLNQLPSLLFWFIPTLIGTPFIIRTQRRYRRGANAASR
jgi:hypothetical protein